MVRKERKRISYVLPLAKSEGGHRLGVNGLAVDPHDSVLYSGGRDGVICAWNLNVNLDSLSDDASPAAEVSSDQAAEKKPSPATTFRQRVQAHTNWIDDLVLAESNRVLVSASSDITVKVWRPGALDKTTPQTIGLHSDYVKTLASPGPQSSWVASGGLDRKICLWDLSGAGEKLKIEVKEDDNKDKGSVYALAATSGVLAGGGPESIVRVWDARSGKRITKFVGHTDNIRDVLISEDGDTIMSASSDQTVKVWSMTAGRCMYTLTMHGDSVWSMYSDHPRLSVFYSSDRSGVVAKTDTRGVAEMDEGLSVAICQEHEGVNKVIHAGNYLWTSTSSSSINRWLDVETEAVVQMAQTNKLHARKESIATTRTRASVMTATQPHARPESHGEIPSKAVLRLSNTAPFHHYPGRGDADAATLASRRGSEPMLEMDEQGMVPIRSLPDHTIEGQNGLIKHILLNDRRRVLTLDTAGEVMMWDLLQCRPIKTFGKRHMQDILPEVNTTETVAHWCAVDTRTGSLTCALEENHCFDAEMYADELQLDETIEFREDQRINLGKWILRYLFTNLIDEEIRRDEVFRHELTAAKGQASVRDTRPNSVAIPPSGLNAWPEDGTTPTSVSTMRPSNDTMPITPGMGIGIASPAVLTHGHGQPRSSLDTAKSPVSQAATTPVADRLSDYFSAVPAMPPTPVTPGSNINGHSATDNTEETPASPTENRKDSSAVFGKKFGLKMSFGMRKLGRVATSDEKKAAPAAEEDKKSEDSDERSSNTDHKTFDDNFLGCIRRMRREYEYQVQEFKERDKESGRSVTVQDLRSAIAPSLPNETPVLKPPPQTTILIQEDRPDAGGVADLFEGTVSSLGSQADLIEKAAPLWLANVLLRNTIPAKDIAKVAFIVEPFPGSGLPAIASDGNNRLNANRMLRARKIMSYVAERIESHPAKSDPAAMKPEEYLELYCQNQIIPPTMTLATIRAHVWRGGGDVLLYYKTNGQKEIKQAPELVVTPAASEVAPIAGSHPGGRTGSGAGSVDQSQRTSKELPMR